MRIPQNPPDVNAMARRSDPNRVMEIIAAAHGAVSRGKYFHWDKLRRLRPPDDLTTQEWWLATKWARRQLYKNLPNLDVNGKPFQYAMVDPVLELVSRIDRDASGRIEIPEQVTDPITRDKYIVSSLMEEAITSSQLEGAATTREIAKEMIRTERKPVDNSERMILNNYKAIQRIRRYKDEPLTPELVVELQQILTVDTLDNPDAVGRLRLSDEKIDIVTWDNEVLHTPPAAKELPKRMAAMCDFANGKTPDYFIHPVVRAILLHFWLAYDHPFVDGNGRTARAIFYWSMLSQGYWLCEYISISQIIRKAPAKYGRAFLYTETDDNDVTYFILHQLEVIQKAIEQLHRYLKKKAAQLRQTENLLRQYVHLNHRQIALLSHALRHSDARYSIRSHQTSHNVANQTARSDLLNLTDRGLLVQRKIGRTM
ncbi:MAG: Fic family protein, partial [Phycisphaerae bacterium]|nr:Fic family protein [Phycisphaerae bacterium]